MNPSLLDALFTGPNHWHPPLLKLLNDLTPAQALWTPPEGRHNIWQLVRHVAFWRRFSLALLRTEEPPHAYRVF